ncbi:MAG: universal stress protein [Propionibacterium sp.]|nr:universal stress protein [Propionibacterium sp.]
MSERPRVLVGVDGSDDSMRALSYAQRTAEHRGSDLWIVHAVDDAVLAGAWGVVYDPTALQEAGRNVLEEARQKVIGSGFPHERVHSDVVMGNPGGVLARLSEKADLMVVGRRSISGLERLFVGSTSVGVAATSKCPVIMISAANMPELTGQFRRIGVGVDNTHRGKAAVEAAFEEASLRGAELEVIHAWQPPNHFFADWSDKAEGGEHQQAVEQGVEELLGPLRRQYPQVRLQVKLIPGHPVPELTARSEELDLLYVGVHTIAGFGVGAVVRALMAHSNCPLALVRPHKH